MTDTVHINGTDDNNSIGLQAKDIDMITDDAPSFDLKPISEKFGMNKIKEMEIVVP